MRWKLPIAAGAVAVVVAVVVVLLLRGGDDPGEPEAAAADDGIPAAWEVEGEGRVLEVEPGRAVVTLGPAEVAAPTAGDVEWQDSDEGGLLQLTAETEILGETATYAWNFADGNPHSVFAGELTLPMSELAEPVVGTISLPDGEVSYVDASLETVAFAGEPITLPALTSGSIVWKHGADALTLWQWRADEVRLLPGEDGGVDVEFHWWNPSHHQLPEGCAQAVADVELAVRPRLTISFGALPTVAIGRHPDGVASVVVPIFFDPREAEDPRFADGASVTATDFARRARTIAMGHSATNDARYGNGGLVGLGVGGTIVVPDEYSGDEALKTLRESLGQTTVELVDESIIAPDGCAAWKASLTERGRTLTAGHVDFDGRFPNLLAPKRRSTTPGLGEFATVWAPTRLTGRRKDVVRQSLSRTYLDRMAERRGLAVLEIPIIATRNPLIPAAAEALLEAERKGNWTIQEDLARALAEVELLSEEEQFDFMSLGAATRYLRAVRAVEIDELAGGEFAVHNPSNEPVSGYTLVIDGVVTALVDDESIEQETRTVRGGEEQTWLWWDLPAETTQRLRIESPDVERAEPVRWTLLEN